MSAKGKNQRQLRKQVLRHVESTFDLQRLEFKKRVTPQKHRAKLVGVMVAAAAYSVGFGLAYFAWQTGRTEYETFAKFSWIFMLPSSVIGVFAYMLSGNRREYAVAKDIMAHMLALEGAHGLLWRYEPVMRDLLKDDGLAQRLVEASRHGELAGVEPEDYAQLIQRLHEALRSGEGVSLSAEAVDAFEENLAEARNAA